LRAAPCVLKAPSCRSMLPVVAIVTLNDVPAAVETCAEETIGRLPKESVEGQAVMPGNVPCPPAVASVDTSPEVSLATGRAQEDGDATL